MLDRSIRSIGIAVFLICLLGPGTAFATVKCQCNNGTVTQAVGSDYDDDDLDDACDDACSMLGGGRVWQLDRDRENIYDSGGRGNRIPQKPSPRRR
jgi:hypothetical protein